MEQISTTGDPQADEEARIQRAFQRADAKLAAMQAAGTLPVADEAPQAAPTANPEDGKSVLAQAGDAWKSIGWGVAKAGLETKDFLVGEPTDAEKSGFRKDLEQRGKELTEGSTINTLAAGIGQITTGLIGAGKIMAPVKAAKWFVAGGKAAKAGFEIARGAAAGSVVLDPHEDRLSNLVEQFPDLQNPVTEYLAAKPGDSAAEGRLKNALESIGADFALVGSLKVIKLLRAGKSKAASKAIVELEKEQKVAAKSKAAAQTVEEPAVPAKGGDAKAPEAEGAPKEVIHEQVDVKPMLDEKGNPVLPTAKSAPAKLTTQEIPDSEVSSILKESQADAEAIKVYGSKAAALDAGHKFANKVKLPWQKLHLPGGSQSLVERSAQTLVKRFNKLKGGAVMHDTRVRALANDIAETYGEDPALIVGQLSQAGADAPLMAGRMEAALRIGNKMFNDADELATKIRNGSLDEFGGDREKAVQEFTARLGVAFDVLGAGNSLLANSGRTLRRARTQFRIRPGDLKKLQGMDPEKVMVVMQKANGDPKMVSMLLNDTWSGRVMREANWHLTNGLLWMWPTHLVNTTTNAFMLMGRPTEKLFGSTAMRLITKDPGKVAELTSVSRQARREYHYTVASLSDAWSNAVEAFRRGDSILSPQNTEFFQDNGGLQAQPLQWKAANSIWDVAQNAWQSANYRSIVGLPTRALGGADEFFKQLRYRAVVQSKAAVDAQDFGLTGQEFKDYLQKSLDEAIDPATGRALDANAIREAQMTTFQQDLNYDTTIGGSIGRSLQNARKTAPILSLVLPFVKTPINVIRYGIKLTPGLNLVQKEFRDALLGTAGAEAQAQAMGQMAMGSIFAGFAAHMAATGSFTGSGPDDYKLKQELLATGWKPYSATWVGDDGKRKYFHIGRFDPAATVMGLVSDIVHLQMKNPDADYTDLIMATTVATAKNLGEKTFLLNLNSMMEALLDPEARLGKTAGRLVGGMIPGSSLLRGANPDPYLREARTFVDSAIRGVPGLSETLPITMDVWGDPVERHVGVMFSQDDDLVEAEHNRIMLQTDKGIGKPSPRFEGVDLRDMTLADGKNAYQRLQEISGHIPGRPSLKEELARVIKSPAYQDLPDGDSQIKGTRLNRLGYVVQVYRNAAKKVFMRENKELQALIGQRQREVRGAVLKNRQQKGQPGQGASTILQSLSY